MSLTQQQLESYKGYRGDQRCKKCSWFGHLVCNCEHEERVAAREWRKGLCGNRWNVPRSRVMGCKEDRREACSIRREVQQGMKCWGCGVVEHCLWECPNKAVHPVKGKAQQKEVRSVEAKEKVRREWH